MDLTALQNSPLLQSLGWAIANSLWQSAVLWIAYLLITAVYQGASAKFKNNLSTILLSSAFVWFCITLFSRYNNPQNLSGNSQVEFYQVNINSVTHYNWNYFLNNITTVLPYLSVAYLLLLIFLSIRLINVYRFTNFIKFNGLQKPHVEWKLFVERVAMDMGITKRIKLWVSQHIDVPATIGFIKPVILIPLASINQLTAEQMEAVILHELSHIKRNDYLINLFISIVETILFFNPFIVLLAGIIKRERENCCDDFVIQYQYDRHAYASALLSLERFRKIDLRLAIGATSGKKQLLLRVKRIMEISSNTNFNYGQKLAALLLITGLFCSVAWLSPQNTKILQSASNEKVYETNLNKPFKPKILVAKESDNGIKLPAVKPKPKKILAKTKQELKRLHAAADSMQEDKPEAILLPLSKKEASPTASTHTLFDHGMEYNFDLKKLQSELDRIELSFSFDEQKLQSAITRAFRSKKISALAIEKLIKSKVKSPIENLQHLRVSKQKPTPSGLSDKLLVYVAGSREKSSTQLNRNSNFLLQKGTNMPGAPHGKIINNMQDVSGFDYRIITKAAPLKRNIPKTRVQEKDNLQIVYKDGIIIINGEKVDLTDTKKIPSQLRAEKLPPHNLYISLDLEK